MGLDIRAFKGLKKINNPIFDEYGELIEDQWRPGPGMDWSESVWPGKGKPLESETVYKFDESYSFYAGSYVGYNIWRRDLEKFKGDVAFQELIDFADNEGVIGSDLSVKLRDDFIKYHDAAEEFSRQNGVCVYFMEKYCDWEKAFTMAANSGAIEFR